MLKLKEQRNSRKQGDVGLGVAIGWFAKDGWTICVPLTDNQDFDLVVEKDDGLKKVQIKTTYCKTKYGVYQANLKTSGGNKSGNTIKMFDKSSVDYVFAVTEEGVKYLIPSEVIGSITVISLGKQVEQYIVE